MGMFTSLFGSSGSDKADKMRQSAIDAFNNIKTPELTALQVQLNNYVNAGKMTPEQAEVQLMNSNAFNDIVTDPANTAAQKQALTQLQQIASQGGMTAIDKAQLQDIHNQQNQEAKSRNESVMQNARERGTGNSNINTVNELMNEQSAADRASQAGTQVAANAQQRALQAIQASAALGGSMHAQEYGEKADKANAANAIEQFNTQTQNAGNLENTRTANAAQAMNLQNAQDIANKNTATGNENKMYNAQQNQTVFNDNLQKAQGVAGTYNAWGNDATAQKTRETGADLALLQGAIGTGAKAMTAGMGGPAAAGVPAAASTETGFNPSTMSTNPYVSYKRDPNAYFSEGGEVKSPVDSTMVTPEDVEDFQKFIAEFKPTKMCSGGMAYDEGGVVESTTTEKPKEEDKDTKKKEEDEGIFKRFGDLIGSHAVDPEKKEANPYDFKSGGQVPGHAEMPGDSPMNDTVPARLSPGEVVIPRTVVQHPTEIPSFVEKATDKPFDEKAAALKALMKRGK